MHAMDRGAPLGGSERLYRPMLLSDYKGLTSGNVSVVLLWCHDGSYYYCIVHIYGSDGFGFGDGAGFARSLAGLALRRGVGFFWPFRTTRLP